MPRITYQLKDRKPLVVVEIGVSSPWQQYLLGEGSEVPEPVKVTAIVDTGASHTCVDPSVTQKLAIPQRGKTRVSSATTGVTPALRDEYDVSLKILGDGCDFFFEAVRAIEMDLKEHGFLALIGHDVLKHCLFVYDGEMDLFSLSM